MCRTFGAHLRRVVYFSLGRKLRVAPKEARYVLVTAIMNEAGDLYFHEAVIRQTSFYVTDAKSHYSQADDHVAAVIPDLVRCVCDHKISQRCLTMFILLAGVSQNC